LPIQLNQLEDRIKEAYKFVNNHNSMANSMNDSAFVTDNGVYGIFYKIGGNVATPYQFFLTDSAHHFFRGSLYFDTTPNADSLAPVNAFIYKDLIHLVNTFRWK
jgi:gliding motility-associated lipoprotein GldD